MFTPINYHSGRPSGPARPAFIIHISPCAFWSSRSFSYSNKMKPFLKCQYSAAGIPGWRRAISFPLWNWRRRTASRFVSRQVQHFQDVGNARARCLVEIV